MRPENRDALLTAIAKARGWIDDIRVGAIGSFAEVAEREAQGERHIRLLAPLAFLSPRIIAAIVDGTAPADLTVTGVPKACPIRGPSRRRGLDSHWSPRSSKMVNSESRTSAFAISIAALSMY